MTGILEALLWSVEVAGDEIAIESDSLPSVNAVNQDHNNMMELGDLKT